MVQLSKKILARFLNGENKMATLTIQKPDIYDRFLNGPLSSTILNERKNILQIKWSRLADHSKTGVEIGL
jgi:hypothetical protein